jgi:hypothetical protein
MDKKGIFSFLVVLVSFSVLAGCSVPFGGGQNAGDAETDNIARALGPTPITRTDLPCDTGGTVLSTCTVGGTVYASGVNQVDQWEKACYWVGNTRVDLSPLYSFSAAVSICVSGGNVYTAGSYWNGTKEVACYWKNTEKTDLPVGGAGAHDDSYATSIFVADGVVYTAGSYKNGAKHYACYWKGTARTDLSGLDNGVNSINVSGGKVYIAGNHFSNTYRCDIACYWKDGVVTDLSKDHSYAISICVADGAVYTAGYYYNSSDKSVACYWKGTAKTDLPHGGSESAASSIFVSGGTVYTAGYYRDVKYTGCYWEGTTKTDLLASEDGVDPYAIYMSGGTVYVGGCYHIGDKFTPCYWTGASIAAARAAGVKALKTLVHYQTHEGSDVMIPVVKWYFTDPAAAPAGYHYHVTFSYLYRYLYDPKDPGAWLTIGTYNFNSFPSASVTVRKWPYLEAKLVKGKATVSLVQDSTGGQLSLGSFTEPQEFIVMVISD